MKIILKGTEEEIAGVLNAAAEEIAALVLAAQERQAVNPLDEFAGKVHDEIKRLLAKHQTSQESQ